MISTDKLNDINRKLKKLGVKKEQISIVKKYKRIFLLSSFGEVFNVFWKNQKVYFCPTFDWMRDSRDVMKNPEFFEKYCKVWD